MGEARGRLISSEDKQSVLQLISDACKAGARRSRAAQLLGLTIRSLQRWAKNGIADKRKGSRASPANKMSDGERQQIINTLNSPEFAGLNPNQVVPRLADQGIFLGSESTMYRILRMLKMNVIGRPVGRAKKSVLFR